MKRLSILPSTKYGFTVPLTLGKGDLFVSSDIYILHYDQCTDTMSNIIEVRPVNLI